MICTYNIYRVANYTVAGETKRRRTGQTRRSLCVVEWFIYGRLYDVSDRVYDDRSLFSKRKRKATAKGRPGSDAPTVQQVALGSTRFFGTNNVPNRALSLSLSSLSFIRAPALQDSRKRSEITCVQ